MVSIVHGNQPHLETMPASHDLNLVGIVVGHQEVALYGFAESEEAIMVETKMTVEPIARLLASRCIRRIDKENSVFTTGILMYDIQSVFLPEANTIRNDAEIRESSGERGGVPSRTNALSILTVFHEAGSLSQNAAVKCAIPQNGLERLFFDVSVLSRKYLQYGILREIEFQYSPCKPLCLSVDNQLPHCGYVIVEFNHDSACDKVLK
jgi:hypothetical protein